jgi:hypothetical protein
MRPGDRRHSEGGRHLVPIPWLQRSHEREAKRGRMMANPPDTWLRLHCAWYEDERILSISNDERVLYLAALGWSHQHGTDGRFPTTAVEALGRMLDVSAGAVDNLCAAGLWTRNGTGWKIPRKRYETWQETAAERAQLRSVRAERQRAYRSRQQAKRDDA